MFLSELFFCSRSRLFYGVGGGWGARMYRMASVGWLMMRAVAVIRVPPDWLPSLCTASLMSPAQDIYIGPYRCVTKQFIVIYATINAMGKYCAHTYVHSGFCEPLFLCISASIKPSHKEVMGFHGPLEKLCANPERTEWEQGLSAPICLGGAPPNALIPGRGCFKAHSPDGTFHVSLDQSKEGL